MRQENPRYWKIDNWALSDLYSLNVRLKTKFNASKTDLMNINARIIASS
jgi:glycerol kinase